MNHSAVIPSMKTYELMEVIFFGTSLSLSHCSFLRLKIEHPNKKRGTLDRLVFADPSKTATFNAAFLEHVAWAFRVTSHLRNKIAGRGVAITRV